MSINQDVDQDVLSEGELTTEVISCNTGRSRVQSIHINIII